MAVLGKNCFIFVNSRTTCEVALFSPNIEPMSLPIVDAVIVYDCPYSTELYLLMICNALYVKEMVHNLIPPFLLREANVIVDKCPKFYARNVTTEKHSL